MARTCTQCGHVGSDDDRFCSVCGAPLDSAGESSLGYTSTGLLAINTPVQPGGTEGGWETGDVPSLDEGTVAALSAGDAVLLVRRGPLEGERFVLTGPEGTVVTVGRSPESDLFLDDVTVSRKHAEFRHGSTGWSVCDVGSLNGTYVNRERIDDVTLASDAEVQIGKYRFTYLTAPGIGS
jgi:hypothetical protein